MTQAELGRHPPSRWHRTARAATLAALALAVSAFAFLAPPMAAAGTSDTLQVTVSPRDAWPPAAVTDLRAAAGLEGQMLLEWTAPFEDTGIADPSAFPVASYEVRSASFSVAAAGSTTAWTAISAPLAPTPPPLVPGSLQSMLLTGLEPGATLYFSVKSADDVGLISPIDDRAGTIQQAFGRVFDAVPPAPVDLRVVSSGTSVTLAWNAVAAPDLDHYLLRVDTTVPYDFGDAVAVTIASTSLSTVYPLTGNTTFFFRVFAVDHGVPLYPGEALESPPSNTVTLGLASAPRRPLPPNGFDAEAVDGDMRYRWLPVMAFDDGSPYFNPGNPNAAELDSYRLEWATAPVGAPWNLAVTLPADTTEWIATPPAGTYYRVKAHNVIGYSEPSMLRGTGEQQVFVPAPDDASMLEIAANKDAPVVGDGVNTESAYRIAAASRPEDLGGRVLKSLEFLAYKGSEVDATKLELPGMGILRMKYDQVGGLVVPSGVGVQAAVATPENVGVYWYNGTNWVQFFGKLDEVNKYIVVETRLLGRYQLRSVERTQAFSFDAGGLSSRFLTPNGDGRNDTVIFIYQNPRDSAVSGKVFDLKGAFVSEMGQGPIVNSLMWDGKSGGSAVPGGVYIFQIKAEDFLFNGTVVVIK
ncbi:MAG: hypothetical protein HYZ75_12205 [Elusimicrobia bacterium]|nr:hypothetical protein [Elusimicrobiota bacterium]